MKHKFVQSQECNNQSNILIKQFSAILNLKLEVFQKNISGTYNFLQKCFDLPKCCCSILDNKTISKEIFLDERITSLYKLFKGKMLSNSLTSTSIDEQIYIYINEETCSNLFRLSFPIELFIKMKN